MTTTSTFSSSTGQLTVLGDTTGSTIVTRRDQSGQISVDGVTILGGQPTVGNTSLIEIFGQAGKDTISVDETNGPMPATNIFGGDGDDKISGGSGNDMLSGEAGNDTINGGDGNDTITGGDGNDLILGGNGNDTVIGGRGNDNVLLGAGNDTFIWSPGDGNDTVEGGAGTDTMLFNGANANENLNITANGGRVRFTRDVSNVVMDLNSVEQIQFNAQGGADNITIGDLTGTSVTKISIDLAGVPGSGTGDGASDTVTVNGANGSEQIQIIGNGNQVTVAGTPETVTITGAEATNDHLVINGLGGNDTIDASRLTAGVIGLTIDGGAGNDTITGGDGNDLILGGNGNDTVIGGRGNDNVLLGAGNDTLIWNPGDGNDTVEGGAGTDTMLFNGANANENINITANGGRVRSTRDDVVMDLNSVEQIQFNAQGGADNVTVNDLTGTSVTKVAIDLAGVPGGGTGDGASDTVTVNGANSDEQIVIIGNGNQLIVAGPSENVTITGAEATNDHLVINGLGGNDTIDASRLTAGVIGLTIDGGAGNDTITGSAGNDFVRGGQGNDVAQLGAGDDTFAWDSGDGNDTVEGQGGFDTMLFNGTNVSENIDISANGSRVRLARDVSNVVMDLNSVERIQFNAQGGAGNVTVNDLTGTSLTKVAIDLAAVPGSGTGDGASDTVTVNGANSDEQIVIIGNGNQLIVAGPSENVTITGAEATNDHLVINGLGGNDTIDASRLTAGVIGLTIDGGAGNDTITGSAGNDFVRGGQGNDMAQLGAGDDTFAWDSGDGNDTVEGQGGFDTMLFNGTNVSENIDISANGSRVRLARDVSNVVMDLNSVERIQFNAQGGADNITVNDLTGTDATEIDLNLGGIDAANDTVTLNATDGAEVITVSQDFNGDITVTGLSKVVKISGISAGDRLVINSRGGDDIIQAPNLNGGVILLTENGGDGADVLVGSHSNDILLGGNGDDVLIGNGGQDILDGGPGNNILIQLDNMTLPPAAGVALLSQFMASFGVPSGLDPTVPSDPMGPQQQPLLSVPQHT